MKDFRTFNLAVEFYRAAQSLSIKGPLKDQLERASSSIALNLAEGRGKRTRKDQVKFFHNAYGSIRECQAILALSGASEEDAGRMLDSLAASCYRLIERAV